MSMPTMVPRGADPLPREVRCTCGHLNGTHRGRYYHLSCTTAGCECAQFQPAAPFVTPDDLDASLKFVMQQNSKYMIARITQDEDAARLHFQSLEMAVAEYHALLDHAEAESRRAHRRHMPTISA